MAKIHPTAIVDPSAELDEGVEIGPYCVVEADVRIGAGTVLRGHVVVHRYTTMGEGNFVDAFVSLGSEPQDLKFDPKTVSHLTIGDHNTFREGVTISRATGENEATVVGDHTYWMAHSHAGHNSKVGDRVILVNGAALAGHVEVGNSVILSAHVGIHQFCWIGDLVMSQGNSSMSCHVPPYVIFGRGLNNVVGLNRVGLRRASHLTEDDRREIKEAFRLTYRSGLTFRQALERMDACEGWGEAAARFRDFVRRVLDAKKPHDRTLCPMRSG
jgi:UDP-N-acetylglucosamine acyltransferase